MRRGIPVLALFAALLGACGDNVLAPGSTERVVVVLNGWDATLTLVPIGNANVRTISVGSTGSPTTLAVRGSRAVVPMGSADVVKIIDLDTRTIERIVSLPAGSGATGVAFLNDSIALVANPGRNSVSPVNVLRGSVGPEVAVGDHPRAVATDASQVYVVNGTVGAAGDPLGPGSVTVLRAGDLQVVGTVQLSGLAPAAAALRGARLFVINSGTNGGNNSSLSVVDVVALRETTRVDQVGNLPRSLTTMQGHPVYIAAGTSGVLIYDPDTNAFVHGAGDPMIPADRLPVSSVKLDDSGLLYSVHPGNCTGPGVLLQITSAGSLQSQAGVGVCPMAIGFATLGA